MFDLTIALIRNTGLLAIIAVAFGALATRWPAVPRPVLHGVLGGLGVIVAMLDPTPIAPGIFIDSRGTPAVLAGYFGGPLAGILAAGIGSAYRLSLGGIGAVPGAAVVAVAAILGSLAHVVVVRRGRLHGLKPLVVVALLSPVSLVGIFLLPMPIAVAFFSQTWLAASAVSVLGVLFLGLLIGTELRRTAAEDAVRRLAFTDDLSGLHNRRSFYRHLEAAWAVHERDGEDLSLLTLDIDRFKSINDRHGHLTGDEVIRRLGDILRAEARPSDVAARLGGEEFAVMLPCTGPREALVAAERLRARLADERIDVAPDLPLAFTVSIGVASASGALSSKLKLLSAADDALYAAKSRGRNRVVSGPVPPEAPALTAVVGGGELQRAAATGRPTAEPSVAIGRRSR